MVNTIIYIVKNGNAGRLIIKLRKIVKVTYRADATDYLGTANVLSDSILGALSIVIKGDFTVDDWVKDGEYGRVLEGRPVEEKDIRSSTFDGEVWVED